MRIAANVSAPAMRVTSVTSIAVGTVGALALLLASGCSKKDDGAPASTKTAAGDTTGAGGVATPAKLSGAVKVDGSSTVFPISEAMAEEFGKKNGGVRVTVGISGTGGGFKKFCAGEIDIADASRPIKSSEIEACKTAGIEYVELPVAYDGIAVVVNKDNDFLKALTVADLKKIWEPEAQGKITTWKQVRAEWPDQPLRLFGAGVDSGTYDYFTEAVVGKAHSSRGDYTSSEDDNVIVTGVAGDKHALGFFGFAYYNESKDKLKIVPVDGGKGPIEPTLETIANGSYAPLSRPIFIYVSKKAFDRPEVAAFIDFYLAQAKGLTAEVGYIPLPDRAYEMVTTRAKNRVAGTVFKEGVSAVGMTIEKLLETEAAAAK